MNIEKQNWEERFDNLTGYCQDLKCHFCSKRGNIKDLIKDLLLEREKELWQKMEEIKDKDAIPGGFIVLINEKIAECQSLLALDEKFSNEK